MKAKYLIDLYFILCSAPCDIVGDVSYEELRAAAYEDAIKG
jgi:nucleoporin-like protein 2